jgi:gamma-glutamyltranspeptidase/glutathione hydrolase
LAERATNTPVHGARAAVSAGHPLAAQAALDVLAAGGNVMDAALAASGVASVVEPAWCGIGGDGFMLVRQADGSGHAFNGSGAAPAALTDARVGADAVPRVGPLSIAVPGLVGAWLAAQRFATRPLADLLAPAIAYARDGFAVYPRLARAIASLVGAPDVSPGLAALIAANGSETGATFTQPDLARTLAEIAARPETFYRGELASAIVAGLGARGGVLSASDLAAHAALWSEPLRARYRGYEVTTNPLVSLGCVLLQELRILEGFDLGSFEPGDAELIELEVASATLATADADRHAGDPSAVEVPLASLLSDERAVRLWGQIVLGQRQPPQPNAAVGSDTTSIVVADNAGNVACVLQSLFNEWGSRELVAGTGALLNDRLANVRVGGDSPNRLRPGRRPLHTLHAYVVTRDDRFVVAGATPGGRGQSQTNLQVLVNLLDLGLDVQAAIDRPRWLRGLPRRGRDDRTVYLEPGFGPDVAPRLRAAGHAVEDAPAGGLEAFGNCTVIARDTRTGGLLAGSDGRRGSRALGW